MKYKEYKFLNKTIYLYFPDDWIVSQNSINSIKVKFPFGPYPTLDCYLDCFDNPKSAILIYPSASMRTFSGFRLIIKLI